MAETNFYCANCNQPLDLTDKFCRECGLPTLRRAEAQAQISALSPDGDELKRALDSATEPRPFLREEAEPTAPAMPPEPLHTSDVVRATNPTFITNLASSTALMVGLIVMLAVVGIVLIVLALRP